MQLGQELSTQLNCIKQHEIKYFSFLNNNIWRHLSLVLMMASPRRKCSISLPPHLNPESSWISHGNSLNQDSLIDLELSLSYFDLFCGASDFGTFGWKNADINCGRFSEAIFRITVTLAPVPFSALKRSNFGARNKVTSTQATLN